MASPTELCWRCHGLPLRQRIVLAKVCCMCGAAIFRLIVGIFMPDFIIVSIKSEMRFCSQCLRLSHETVVWALCHTMMTSWNRNIFHVSGHLCGEFTAHRWIPAWRPVTRSFDVFFDLRLNQRFSKQSVGWWFETPSHPLWHHCNISSYHNLKIRIICHARDMWKLARSYK